MQLNLPLGTVIKAFKVYKIISKYYNQKPISLNDFKNQTSNLSTDDLMLNAFSMLLDFIADTYDLDNNTYGKDTFHIFKILEEVNYNVKAYPQELYPSFVFNPILSEEKSGLIDRLDKLNSMGFLDATSENDREFVRNIDGLPKESELIDNESDFIKNTGSTRPNNVLLDDVTSAKTDLLMDQVKAVSYSEYTDE